jgi:diaminopimelate epimerase
MAEITKAHGSRNDIFITALTPADFLTDVDLREFVRALCDRTSPLGGGDGIYFHDAGTLQAWFFNPDGSAAEFCGNGMRCLGRFVLERRETDTATLRSGSIDYTVTRGTPQGGVTMIRLEHPQVTFQQVGTPTELTVPNPHRVSIVDHYDETELLKEGMNHPGTNVSHLLPVTRDEIFVRTHERGAGLTASCGSGMVAARAVYSRLTSVPQTSPVTIHNAGGQAVAHLNYWRPVLEGNATYLYRAEVGASSPAELFPAESAAYDAFEQINETWLSSHDIHTGPRAGQHSAS